MTTQQVKLDILFKKR